MLRLLAGLLVVMIVALTGIVEKWLVSVMTKLSINAARRFFKARRARKKAEQRRQAEAAGGEFLYEEDDSMFLNGRLTYSGVAVLALAWLGERFGIPATPEEWEGIVAAGAAMVGLVAGIYGRYRATKKVEQ